MRSPGSTPIASRKKRHAASVSISASPDLPAPDGKMLGFVDVPGHERFVHNMLAGAGGIDFVLLAVAADDEVMPQTREHLAIVDLLGVGRGIVALTKVDLVAVERRQAVAAEIARTLDGTGLAASEIVPVSPVTGEGLDKLRARLFAAAQAVKSPTAKGRFRLAVDRSFSLTGVGTVVTGTVLSGVLVVADHVKISPSGIRRVFAQSMRKISQPIVGRLVSVARSISRAVASPRTLSTAVTWCSIPNSMPQPTGSMRRCASSPASQS